MTADPGDERNALVEGLRRRGHVESDRVADALRTVPRHEFVPAGRRSQAYADRPLSIGSGQTVSAPHMVGMMCELLAPDAEDEVLEVGTGCGYHAAVTAELVPDGHVYSVEYDADLADDARETLERLGYADRISVRVGDGRKGWVEHAPFDGVYVTCAVPSVPDALREQLRPGGRIVAPVGKARQTLVVLEKRDGGTFERTDHGGVRFVRIRG
ncbi:protein-L-isoaspartate(D-aspartate) O-methyltransferase [Halobellus ordinarius]|uniref:protein-L-isoaspartate(D-aspartate) O-methyltransferase n=1 Tax=Halobellus ordinarius TaxID=3075120 RepID=UPI0028804AC6|nr:protein-L-isoaspartate(D-aspartate) O-methyltransferase [Halobellus sp. ZY16]